MGHSTSTVKEKSRPVEIVYVALVSVSTATTLALLSSSLLLEGHTSYRDDRLHSLDKSSNESKEYTKDMSQNMNTDSFPSRHP